jgi:hypothetical protein
MLRSQVAKIINSGTKTGKPSNEIAKEILFYLDDEGLSLDGNGWFDDDPQMTRPEEKETSKYRPGVDYTPFE